ncbi:MAG: hypothetical protein COA30_04300 [Sulfurimonas sp.]|nr:MAG: hypothetical protein COA30_04300 [Sulfurimonas sp.]
MKKIIPLSMLCALSLMADATLDTIQKELETQKQKTAILESQIQALSRANVSQSASFSQNAYLPDIAFILDMSAVARDVNNTAYSNYSIPGFIAPGDAELIFNPNRGFNLNYAELALHSSVDPYFDAFLVLHLQSSVFEIEEAYVITTSLPMGLRVKAGKFRSDFGRLNKKHHHSWHFDSQALIHEALLGPDALKDPGVQLQWVAPTDTYLMLGAEAMQGINEASFGAIESNNLYTGYLKSSIDIGESLSLLGGMSIIHGENFENNSLNPTDIYGIDFTLREQLGSYSSLLWQNEYIQREKNAGTRVDKQAGFYSELIYTYNNNYATGLRYDAITQNDTDNLDRFTAMLEYKPFEMSRLRLSYTYDRSKIISGERKNINEVMLSLNISAGAHSAHDF